MTLPGRCPAIARMALRSYACDGACRYGWRVKSVLVPRGAAGPARRVPGRRLLVAGAAAFGVAIALYAVYAAIHPAQWTLDPVDLAVYRSGGLIVRHVRPVFDPRVHAPLYDWGGYGSLGLKFTYTPFAAIVFAVVSFIPWSVLPTLSMGVNIVALVAALWFTFGGLDTATGPGCAWVRRCWPPPPCSGPSPWSGPCTSARSTWC